MNRIKYICLIFLAGTNALLYGTADYSIILERNIFSQPPPPKPEIKETPIIKPPPVPALSSMVDLTGIIYFSEGDSFAVLNLKRRNEEVVYKAGDVIESAEIIKVEENSVTFMYDGKEEKLYLKQDAGNAGLVEVSPGVTAMVDEGKNEDGTPKIINPSAGEMPTFADPVSVDFSKTLADLRNDKDLMKNLNVAPDVKNGKIEGFRMNNIPPGSLPYAYGLRDGDVLRSVNGVFIDSVAKGFSVYNQIVKDKTEVVTVEVLRNNSPLVFTFRLK
ncbi:MAG: hypothetical protein JW957_06890 [Candidatus Omnitrophica bacterium]|nr:hypothetical protein [Candidatus Omnitrophota bacterium]